MKSSLHAAVHGWKGYNSQFRLRYFLREIITHTASHAALTITCVYRHQQTAEAGNTIRCLNMAGECGDYESTCVIMR
ncbi:hypothetical protein [Acidithiobacillus ferrivorans]|uniref:Uncharacterized protein n=1 Tax=Acidithiobacillus ferrivorans TaxID=160808 RepID=A0A1B9C0C9_9PROT|nr:hypothetical protein [Acidithiobacillus ferrivorans]MBN6740245.1 hypothetical protein [Acidithiobacillus sp. MC6.1]OCB03436.1 hypothetical protein BBC27_07915 [Acidithiobacillus ferrivorans]QQD71745.1 hypothetical protein H2515_09805 [Acidithiobacillus ferrivorans]